MDDKSCLHRAHVVNDFLQDNYIARLERPACSPDMNPIKHALDRLKRAVYGRLYKLTTLRDIRRIAVEEWDNLGQQCLDELVDSMPRGHASMQEDMLLGIRGIGVYCNLDHNF